MLKSSFVASLFILAMCISGGVRAQTNLSEGDVRNLRKVEDSLIALSDSMFTAFIPDTRVDYCQKFAKMLVRALKTPNSYEYGFDSLGKKINIIKPDDNAFRIFNWPILPDGIRPRYYGAVQMAGSGLKLYPLFDRTTDLGKGVEDSILTNERWFGALYYRILTNEVRGEKIYTLFGLNSSNLVSNKKVLEPMRITENGISFGAPIFGVASENNQNGTINRYIMEYRKDVQASLNWDDELKLIYFDRLVSQSNDPNRKYTYVPSGQYDGFRWSGNRWTYVQDLIPVQPLKDGEAPAPVPLAPKN